ncbi:MAG: hypothetical protein IJX86_12990 [Lachnospiraceae bacterium]|nr:hypothetical protein [Lachnospiraceae bacterium]
MINELIHEITVKAIEGVPKAIITDDKRVNEHIQSLCKEVLTLSKNRTGGEANNEVGILSSLDGSFKLKPIYGYWDDKIQTCKIDVDNNENYQEAIIINEENSLVFVHNHPNNSKVSYNDLINLITTPSIKIVVAVANNGNISFAFRFSDDFRKYTKLYMKMQSEICDAREKGIKQYVDNKYKDMMTNPSRYGLVIAESRRVQ